METSTPARQAVILRCRVCGARVKATRALRSKAVRCVDCGDRALLRSFGIDPEAARLAYERERLRSLPCSRCARRLEPQEVTAQQGLVADEDLMCEACQAGQVEQRGRRRAPRPDAVADAVVLDPDVGRRAWAYGAFFFLGFAGFMHSLLGAGPLASAAVALLAAAAGRRAILEAHTRRAAAAAGAFDAPPTRASALT